MCENTNSRAFFSICASFVSAFISNFQSAVFYWSEEKRNVFVFGKLTSLLCLHGRSEQNTWPLRNNCADNNLFFHIYWEWDVPRLLFLFYMFCWGFQALQPCSSKFKVLEFLSQKFFKAIIKIFLSESKSFILICTINTTLTLLNRFKKIILVQYSMWKSSVWCCEEAHVCGSGAAWIHSSSARPRLRPWLWPVLLDIYMNANLPPWWCWWVYV